MHNAKDLLLPVVFVDFYINKKHNTAMNVLIIFLYAWNYSIFTKNQLGKTEDPNSNI